MDMAEENVFLNTIVKRFVTYQKLGENALLQLNDEEVRRKLSPGDNNIAIIIRHMHGNMLSRFTDFLTSDGEKPWRNRDGEFEDDNNGRAGLLQLWNEGWSCVINAMRELKDNDLDKHVTIRGETHLVLDAILRQIAHYAYHVGQIVFIAKSMKGVEWRSLSIPKNESEQFNAGMREKYG